MDLTAVPGLPETALGTEAADSLPASAPPAPWPLELSALLWPGRPPRGGVCHLPSAMRSARLLVGGGGMIRYANTPVGPYSEVLAGALLLHEGRPALHVPFMAVDSAASVVGGRANWSLPKTFASFEGDPASPGEMDARGEGWKVRATARPLGPAFPFRARVDLVQAWPDGSVRRAVARLSGRGRLARVRVAVSGSGLGDWLRPGARPGVVLERVRGVLGPAE